MDVLGLLAAVVAVTIFPGGVYACAAAGGAALAGRLPHGRRPWSATEAASAVLLLFGAALVPLPQAPATALPSSNGAPANLLAAMLLIGGGIAAGTPPARWTRWRITAGVAAMAPLLVLAASAATLSFPVVVTLPGRELAAARALAATALLAAAPLLGRVQDPNVPRGLRALSLAVPALVAAVLLAPPGWSNLPAAAAAGMTLAGIAIYAGLGALTRRVTGTHGMPPALLAPAAAIASIVLTALASR
ncbi:MAG TPA: hypothetical protein VGQ42_16935 [Candidatus Dormibacteraeota bacterium]|jgi:hypothetical protein|nr:hypothetical protein [Candidatus Dormibacteraeota bacterium]